MNMLINILPTLQIIISVLLILAILVQNSEESLGGAFGGSDALSAKKTRRGAEKFIFKAAIILSILFIISSIFVFLTK